MSVYRAVAGRRGISIPARTSAKIKTLVQGIAILLALAPLGRLTPDRADGGDLGDGGLHGGHRSAVSVRRPARGAWPTGLMRIEVVAVGTELLLGQIADTNSAWLGEQLALAGVDSHFHQAVGDNQERIVLALRTALARSDGVVVCGGSARPTTTSPATPSPR